MWDGSYVRPISRGGARRRVEGLGDASPAGPVAGPKPPEGRFRRFPPPQIVRAAATDDAARLSREARAVEQHLVATAAKCASFLQEISSPVENQVVLWRHGWGAGVCRPCRGRREARRSGRRRCDAAPAHQREQVASCDGEARPTHASRRNSASAACSGGDPDHGRASVGLWRRPREARPAGGGLASLLTPRGRAQTRRGTSPRRRSMLV